MHRVIGLNLRGLLWPIAAVAGAGALFALDPLDTRSMFDLPSPNLAACANFAPFVGSWLWVVDVMYRPLLNTPVVNRRATEVVVVWRDETRVGVGCLALVPVMLVGVDRLGWALAVVAVLAGGLAVALEYQRRTRQPAEGATLRWSDEQLEHLRFAAKPAIAAFAALLGAGVVASLGDGDGLLPDPGTAQGAVLFAMLFGHARSFVVLAEYRRNLAATVVFALGVFTLLALLVAWRSPAGLLATLLVASLLSGYMAVVRRAAIHARVRELAHDGHRDGIARTYPELRGALPT